MADIELFARSGPGDVGKDWLYDSFINNPPKLMSVDIETVSLKNKTIIGIGFGLSATEACYVPAHSPAFLDAVLMLTDSSITKVYHNVMFDLPILLNFCPGVDAGNVLDTMMMCNFEGLPQELASIVMHFGMDIQRISDILPKRATMDQLPDDVVAVKCMNDCKATMLVYEKLWPHVNQEYFYREMKLVNVLTSMSQRGIKIDQERRRELEVKLERDVEYYKSLAEAEGFNPGSPQQVAYTLMQRGCRVPVVRKNGSYTASTDEEVLKKLDDPMAALVLNYRHASKLLSTYIRPYADCDRAYTKFHMNAATGRVSSTDRNMQNIPPGAGDVNSPGPRTMFLPDSGIFTDLDFSQQELRTLAYMSQDPIMLDTFDRGLDIHQRVADFIFGTGASKALRRITKNVNFCAVYGGSPETIMETAGISSIQKAKEIWRLWRTMFPKAAEWIDAVQNDGVTKGYVNTIQGRKLWLPSEIVAGEDDRRRKAVNYPVQGSAAEMTKDALLKCAEKGYELVLQVHDELVIDGDVPAEELRALGLEETGPFKCPIEVKYLERWQ